MNLHCLKTDVLIIGGGTAGCYAALTISKRSPETKVIICEKANIKRSGFLAEYAPDNADYFNKWMKFDTYRKVVFSK